MIGAFIAVAACLTCTVVACTLQRAVPARRLPEGYVMYGCAGITQTTKGQPQAGVWWLSPHARDVPRWAFYTQGYPYCGFVPWLPMLPTSGVITLPP
jgi:hypothetical protein